MTKYTVAGRRRGPNEKEQVDPLWRGVGCIMMVVVPAISYFLAWLTVNLAVARDWPMPYQLMGYPVMPDLLMTNQALSPIGLWIEQQQNLYALLLITIAYVVMLGAVIAWLWAALYAHLGPARYGPLDEPPISARKVKAYKR